MNKNLIISDELYEQLILNAFKSTGFLLVNKQLIKEYGLIGAGILGNYIDKHQFFKDNDENFDGWFYLTFKDQKNELNLQLHTLKKWKDYFAENNILLIKRQGIPAKYLYKINFKKFIFDGKKIIEMNTDPTFSEGLESEIQNNDNQDITKSGIAVRQQNPDPTFSGGLKVLKTEGLYITCIENKNNTILCSNSDLNSSTINEKQFNDFWEIYPKKVNKGKALSAWIKLCNQKNKKDVLPKWTEIRKAIHYQKKSERWQVKEYIPNPSTWINQYMWLTDPKDLVIYNFNKKEDNSPKDKYGKPIPEKISAYGRYWYWDYELKNYYDETGEKYEEI